MRCALEVLTLSQAIRRYRYICCSDNISFIKGIVLAVQLDAPKLVLVSRAVGNLASLQVI